MSPVPFIATGAPTIVYEKRDEAPFHFCSIYYVERRKERGKEAQDIPRRLVLSYQEAMKLAYDIRELFANAGISAL